MLSPEGKYRTKMALYAVNLVLYGCMLWGHLHGQRIGTIHIWIYGVTAISAIIIAVLQASEKTSKR